MKRIFALVVSGMMLLPFIVLAQDPAADQKGMEYGLSSEKINDQDKTLDEQVMSYNKKIEDIVKRYDLLNQKDVRVLPYQTTYEIGDNYLEIEKHVFMKSDVNPSEIAGIQKKSIKIYTNGQTITKIESMVYEMIYANGDKNIVTIVDPSPTTGGTEDIVFTYSWRGKKLVDNKKLSDVKNSTAFPLRNQIKRDFLLPHLSDFYRSLLFIAEAYYKSLKDSDAAMESFLERSMK